MAKRGRRQKHKTNFAAIFVTIGALLILGACAYALPPPKFIAKLPFVPDDIFTKEEVIADKRQEYGIAAGGGLLWMSDPELQSYVAGLKDLGVGHVRFDINWNVIQLDGPQAYNWREHDRVVDAMHQANIAVTGIILYTPPWARSAECSASSVCKPANMDDVARFSTAAAQRYAPRGLHNWEIWNEPNWHRFWSPQPDPAAYTSMLKAAYFAIKTADPQATVILGGLSGTESNSTNIDPVSFMEGVYEAGGKGSFDAVGLHPYTFPRSPAGGKGSWSFVKKTHQLMEEQGEAHKHIWITEYGAPTGGEDGKKATHAGTEERAGTPVTEQVQANLLQDAATETLKYEWIGPFFWYSYKDLGTSATDKEHHFGLLRYDNTKKPAYETLKKLIQNTGGQ